MFTLSDLAQAKDKQDKLSVLTCYDYAFAKILSDAQIDIQLVGDSLGMVVLGYENTQQVTMPDMIRHTQAVARGNRYSLIMPDLPFNSYQIPKQALVNARLLLEAGGHLVKVEGGQTIRPILEAYHKHAIPYCGHVGLTPQTIPSFKVQGREQASAARILADAKLLQELGARAIVLECIPADLAAQITAELTIPTIGIGAGSGTDGQVLVLYDLLGLFTDFKPKFVKQYAQLAEQVQQACQQYSQEVKQGNFPNKEQSFGK